DGGDAADGGYAEAGEPDRPAEGGRVPDGGGPREGGRADEGVQPGGARGGDARERAAGQRAAPRHGGGARGVAWTGESRRLAGRGRRRVREADPRARVGAAEGNDGPAPDPEPAQRRQGFPHAAAGGPGSAQHGAAQRAPAADRVDPGAPAAGAHGRG